MILDVDNLFAEGHEEETELMNRVEIYFNGEKQSGCTWVNTETGVIRRYVEDKNGSLSVDFRNGRAKEEVVKGHVEVIDTLTGEKWTSEKPANCLHESKKTVTNWKRVKRIISKLGRRLTNTE